MSHRFVSVFRRFSCVLLMVAAVLSIASKAHAQNLAFTPGVASTYAGDITGKNSESVANYTGLASGLVMTRPTVTTFDSAGNMFILEGEGAAILRVVAASNKPIPSLPGVSVQAGHVYTVAGDAATVCSTATNPSNGDGCLATQATLGFPYNVAIDPQGNVFLPDQNNEIRVVYAGGTLPGMTGLVPGHIYQYAQTPLNEIPPYVVAVDAQDNVYYAQQSNPPLYVVYSGTTTPGNPLAIPANTPVGSIYTISSSNGCSYTNPASEFNSECGDGAPVAQAGFSNIGGLIVDASGNIYISDVGSGRVRAIYVSGSLPGVTSPAAGDVYTIAGGGSVASIPASGAPAATVSLSSPSQIGFDSAGDMYIGNNAYADAQVYKVDVSGNVTAVFGGALDLDSDAPYDGQPYSFVTCPVATDIWGDGCAATNAPLVTISDVAVDASGNIYVADSGYKDNLIRKSTIANARVDFVGTAGIALSNSTFLISNIGTQPLQLTGITFSGPFVQTPTGGLADCSGTTTLAIAQSCPVGISFTGAQVGSVSGSLVVASNSLNAMSGTNTLALGGTLSAASTTTAISASPAYPTVLNTGQQVTFTASVTPQVGDTLTPTGTVAIFNGSTTVGTGTLNNGVATVQVTSLPAGTNNVTAQYNGDANFTGSTSGYIPVSVTTASAPVANVTLTATPTSALSGQTVTLTATVTNSSGAAITSGTITFQEGTGPLGAAITVGGSGTATFTTSTLPAGQNTLLAVFSGAAGYGANSSNSVIVPIAGNAQLMFAPGVISTIAGEVGTNGYSGDGGPATSAQLGGPTGIVEDGFGNIYFIDQQSGEAVGPAVVRVVASGKGSIPGIPGAKAGYIYTFAGGGYGNICASATDPSDGDGCPATQATLSYPQGPALDAAGNVYIADSSGSIVRKINAQGIITTIAGKKNLGLGYGGDNGPATSAQIDSSGIFVDNAGDVYIVDGNSNTGTGLSNNLLRRVDALTGIITTVAGTVNGAQQYNSNFEAANACEASPCGDGGPATSALLSSPLGGAVDSVGNLYIIDGIYAVRKVDAKTGIITTVAGTQTFNYSSLSGGDNGPATSAQLAFLDSMSVDNAGNLYLNAGTIREVYAQTGIINTIVGGGTCTYPCGDGGLATNAALGQTLGSSLDSQGNLYVTDATSSVVRIISGSTTGINFGNQSLGTNNTQSFTVSNIGAQPLSFTGLTVATISPTPASSPSDFAQLSSGGSDCTATDTSLAAGASCTIDLQWFPTIGQAETATVTVASNAINSANGNNIITLSGSGIGSSGSTAQTITFPALLASTTYGAKISLSASASSGLPISYRISGPGVLDAAGTVLTVTGSGAITVTAYQFGNSQYAAASPVPQMTTSTGGAVLTLTANDVSVTQQSLSQGGTIPALTYTLSGLVNGDTTSGAPAISTAATTSSPAGDYPIIITQGGLTAPSSYQINFVPGTLYITGTGSQTITFNPIGAVPYGVKPITFSATASSKLPVTFTVASGPGMISGGVLTVTGAGAIVMNANQYGDSTYAAAPIVSQTITVNPAPLTVTANSISIIQGEPIPVLTGYSVNTAQLLNGDTQAVLSGTPSETTTATQSSASGPYPINITAGTLTAANYTFNFVAGTLTIATGQAQTISFPPIANVNYGVLPINLTAKTSSGLGLTYLVTSGPATVAGSTLTITGAGTVQVTATQPGAGQYGPATPVSQSFTVAPAVLTLTANNATRIDDTQNPTFTYTLTGFVNGDTQGTATSGSPSLTTTATPGSPIGTYPIVPAITISTNGGPLTVLSSTNYIFTPVDGTLTITSGGPVANFSLTATPAQVSLIAGQSIETAITLTPQNYYQGVVTLGCGTLPANITCVFSPATMNPDGTPAVQTAALTINTGPTAVVAGVNRPESTIQSTEIYFLPGLLTGLAIFFNRKRLWKSTRMQQLLVLAVLLAGFVGLAACGGSSSSNSASQSAAPGTYTVTVTAKGQDGTTNNIPISIQVR